MSSFQKGIKNLAFLEKMKRLRLFLCNTCWLLSVLMTTGTMFANDKTFVIRHGETVTIACEPSEAPVVQTALKIFQKDLAQVFDGKSHIRKHHGDILVGTIHQSALIHRSNIDLSELKDKQQAFLITVNPQGKWIVAGSDAHGTAYGILELSRLIGVSPWEWWADAKPARQDSFRLAGDFHRCQYPSVPFRGIFINDEDWGLMPWSQKNHEPSDIQGHIGPKTNERIFELLLRLRANTYWPAMHECSLPFFLTDGNREKAAEYGIYIGSSHCEPMVCNAAGEWSRRGEGAYDYVHNRDAVHRFWEERVKAVAQQEIVYTLGMRGLHDGQMQGAKSVQEQKAVIEEVLADQRKLIQQYVHSDPTKVPQVFIPYKEVLDIYHAGLQVPDDVTLMWCDDNYGYIRHFPTEAEQSRSGGNGIYYHISYWGRPHDYLWLNSFHPALLFQQLSLAYKKGIQKMWILNVGDIKPGEYLIELFMDMAWDIHSVRKQGLYAHQQAFLGREFGWDKANDLFAVMNEYQRQNFICRPEFLGNTRTEEKDPIYKVVKDMPWSESYIRQRLQDFTQLSDEVERIGLSLPEEKQETYFQLVKYPVQAATQMNHKMLKAQLARHGKADWNESEAAYDSIKTLTARYNTPKWKYLMDYQPRRLPVFSALSRETATTTLREEPLFAFEWDGGDFSRGNATLCEGLGYTQRAICLSAGDSVVFEWDPSSSKKPAPTEQGVGYSLFSGDTLTIAVALLPTHPVEESGLRFCVTLNDASSLPIAYHTQGRSEAWKKNVLQNRTIKIIRLPYHPKNGKQQLVFKALDEGIVLDDIAVITTSSRCRQQPSQDR